ncbi:unnamed protein product [Polarella glacialis]|uniref:Uncharacterized protein n=1 Tax=Polarella glacialis TaxID=89957 RepID=A0A813FPN2_POLGL|nr:unnamed protein product [Polarella glacialis]
MLERKQKGGDWRGPAVSAFKVPLRRVEASGERGLADSVEDIPLSIWMQMYVLPDHEAMLPMLKSQLQEELSRQPQAQLPARPKQAPAAPAAVAAAAVATVPRWGPASPAADPSPSQRLIAAPAATVSDLIDVSLDDGPELIPAAAAASPFRFCHGLLDDDGPELIPAEASSGYNTMLPRLQAFSGYNSELPRLKATPFVSTSSSPSAFGFIAAAAPGPSLDLAALYSDPGEVPKAQRYDAFAAQPKFEALRGLVSEDLGLGSGGKAGAALSSNGAGQPKSLQGLEEMAFSGLQSSMRF